MALSQESTHTPIAPNDFGFLLEQLDLCSSHWEKIATGLRFRKDEIDAIKVSPANLASAPVSYLQDVIGKWQHWAKGDARGSKDVATLEALKRAVDVAGFGDVAKSLTLLEGNCVPTPLQVQSEKHNITDAVKQDGPQLSGLPQDTIDDLEQKLEINLWGIRNKYAAYVRCIRQSVLKAGVTARDLSDFLLTLTAFESKEGPKLFSEKLENLDNIEDIFRMITKHYATFLDYEILESIVDEFVLDTNQKKLNYPEYLTTCLNKFKISQFYEINPFTVKTRGLIIIAATAAISFSVIASKSKETTYHVMVEVLLKDFKDTSKELILKYDIQLTNTLGSLKQQTKAVAKVMGLMPSAVRLLSIKEGCVHVTTLLPAHIADFIFTSQETFTTDQKDQFQALAVLWLQCNDYIFSFEKESATFVHTLDEAVAPTNADSDYRMDEVRKKVMTSPLDTSRFDRVTATPLHTATVERARELLLHAEYSVNCTDSIGWTPLHYACAAGKLEMVRMLVAEFKADTSFQDVDGRTALMLAALAGHDKIVDALLSEYQCPVGTKDAYGNTAFHYASCGGHTMTLEVLLTVCSAEDITTANKFHNTPLDMAALSGHDQVALALIHKFDIDVNGKDVLGESLLHKACIGGNVNLVRALVLEHKADINAIDSEGKAPFHVAALMGKYGVAWTLLTEFKSEISNTSSDESEEAIVLACSISSTILWQFMTQTKQKYISKLRKLIATEKCNKLYSVSQSKLYSRNATSSDRSGQDFSFMLKWYNENKHNPNNVLHVAAINGDIDKFRQALEQEEDINIEDEFKMTPLHYACGSGHVNIVKLLATNEGTEADHQNYLGQTPLHLACMINSVKTVKILITDLKANINLQDINGWTPIMLAVVFECYDVAYTLINEFNCPIDTVDKYGNTVLHYECSKGSTLIGLTSISTAEQHFKFEVSLNKANTTVINQVTSAILNKAEFSQLETKILRACMDISGEANYSGDPLPRKKVYSTLDKLPFVTNLIHELKCFMNDFFGKPNIGFIRTLIDIDSSLCYVLNEQKHIPLYLAAVNGREEVSLCLLDEFFYESNVNDILFHCACSSGNADLVRKLVYMDEASIYVKDHNNNTPLHQAAKHGRREVVTCLIKEFGCEIRIKGEGNNSLLHSACKSGNISLVYDIFVYDLLLKYKVGTVDIQNNSGVTPLHMATALGHTEIALCLIEEFGADVNALDEHNTSLLHCASHGGNVELVRILIQKYGADKEARNSENEAPLHYAAEKGNEEVVMCLLNEFHCKVDERLLHYACIGGKVGLVQHLVQNYALDAEAKNKNLAPLHFAVIFGHIEIVMYLINECACNIYATDISGRSYLHYACEKGHLRLARILITEFKVDPNVKDNLNDTPLELAAKKGQKDIVLCLLDEFQCEVNESLLHRACMGGNINLVRCLVKEYKFSAKVKYQNFTPLHIAVINGHTEIVLYLINECASDIHEIDTSGRSYLHYACMNGHLKLARLLITEHKVDPNVRDKEKLTPLEFAAKDGQKEIVICLLDEFQCKADKRLLLYACMGGNVSLVRYLNQKYHDFGVKGRQGSLSPLHIAVISGHTEIVSYLIDKCDSNVHETGPLSRSCLHYACEKGHLNLARMLIAKYGADPNDRDNNNYTPLELAARLGKKEIVQCLLDEFHCGVEESLLHYACIGGNASLVKCLVEEHKADVYTRDDTNNMAVHLAALHGREETVLYLLKNFDLHKVKGHQNRSLLHFACQSGNKNLVRTLISDFGADLEAKDDYHLSPYNMATLYKKQQVSSCLTNEFHSQTNNINWYSFKIKELKKTILTTAATILFLVAVFVMGLSAEPFLLVLLFWVNWYSSHMKKLYLPVITVTSTIAFLAARISTGSSAETWIYFLFLLIISLWHMNKAGSHNMQTCSMCSGKQKIYTFSNEISSRVK